MSVQSTTTNNNTSSELLKSFQIDDLSIQEKSQDSYGLKLSQEIESTVNGGSSSYFYNRNQRWRLNRSYANGRINMSKFMDLLEFNGKTNYLNLNWQCIHIVNRIVSGLVGRWMNKNEKIKVTATDSLSQKQKQDEYEEVEFILANREKLQQLQESSGVQMMPQDEGLPRDKEELLLWKSQIQRLPEEILYETGCNDVLESCGWFDTLKEKMLHDSAETGFVGTYTWMDSEGVIHVEWCKPEDCFYSYSNYNDFRDTTWRGRFRTMKVSELRKKYGAEFGGKLSEEKIFEIAKTSKNYQLYDNITWMTNWNVTFLRPYDEWNINVMEFELKTVDNQPYIITTTKKNKSTIIKKGRGNVTDENTQVIEDSKINIYRGVYARDTQTLLEWGLKQNMIRPQDPKEIGNAEFSYSFYMVQNYDMMCMAVPEKIQEPADQMIIARLKMQQLVAKMRPIGAAINWDALQNIDYGLGDQNKSIDVKKLYDQTGDIYYRGRDAEGNQVPVPIQELANAGFYNQLQGLILLYDKHYQIMKDELGEDPNLISQALQPRVTQGNVATSQQQAAFATDYFYSAYSSCMADTSRKISCLLKTSVTYGSKVYRKILKEEDVSDRIFGTKVQLLPDDAEQAEFKFMLNQALQTNPDLILFVNPFQLTEIAKQDSKLAWSLFNNGQKKMLIHKQMEAQQNQQATFDAQIKSAQASEQGKQQTEQIKGEIDIQKVKIQEDSATRTATLTLVASLLSKGMPIPPYLQPMVNATIENIMLPMVAQNDEQKAALMQQMKQAQMQQQGQQEQQGEQMLNNEQQEQNTSQETQEQPQQEQQPQQQQFAA
jgi:hypothetical protein